MSETVIFVLMYHRHKPFTIYCEECDDLLGNGSVNDA
jgi:hypothetical protein